ncbi:putative reverse transcriptase domain-containing protein [Tanacetum coccineum]
MLHLLPVTVTCHVCGEKGHYANLCRKTTNNNAQGRAYMLRDRNAHQNPNVVMVINLHPSKLNMSGSQDEIPPPPPPPPPSSSQTPTQQTPHTVSTIKLPILKKGEYDKGYENGTLFVGPNRQSNLGFTKWECPLSITTDTQ